MSIKIYRSSIPFERGLEKTLKFLSKFLPRDLMGVWLDPMGPPMSRATET